MLTQWVSSYAYGVEMYYDKKNAWSGMCKWSETTWYSTRVGQHNTSWIQTCCQMHTILDNTTDEKIWRTLQSQWTMCKCTNTIRPGTKNFTSNAQWITTASFEVEAQAWIQKPLHVSYDSKRYSNWSTYMAKTT